MKQKKDHISFVSFNSYINEKVIEWKREIGLMHNLKFRQEFN